ncbi:MAG: Metallo-peptidase family M12-domain-containing protein [Benjaminiella poitrasii]|nr:MAG: Metallo-peptidase family M12-domain-containing protein [Benjaminiella poitrasii]
MKSFYSIHWLFYICIVAVIPILTLGHNVDNRQVNRIETVNDILVDIAPRPQQFFEKRHQSINRELSPKRIEFDDTLRLSFTAYNQTFFLHLEPNIDLFHPDAVLHHQGESRRLYPHETLVYKGYVAPEDMSDNFWLKTKLGGGVSTFSDSKADPSKLGWARILIRKDLMSTYKTDQLIVEGAFTLYGDIYHIKSMENYNLVKRSQDPIIPRHQQLNQHMIVYRDSDTSFTKRDDSQQSHQCGFDNLEHKSIFNKRSIAANDDTHLLKLTTQGCPKTRKINYMGAAADCTYVKYYKNINNARLQIVNNFNMASAVFEDTFNISLGLINITIMDSTCPSEIDRQVSWNRACHAEYSLNERLSDFSLWRSTLVDDRAGLWHLMTNCPAGVEVGLAWLKQLCNTGADLQITNEGKEQYVSGAGVSAITRDEWKVVAHEIGHGFGAIHDCTSSDCPCLDGNCNCCQLNANQCDSSGFLMSAITNSSAEQFSRCSIDTICTEFPTLGTCLVDPDERHTDSIYQLNMCGNGIKEEGEECDTGGVDTDCCDPKTCKLKPQAVCEDQNESCCHQCQLRPKTHLCRPAGSSCDLPEYCTGESAECPEDSYLRDGTSCGSNGLRCASGQCTSRDDQCLARGFAMNISRSCLSNNEECRLLCNSPSSEKCLIFTGNFIDGTPCGFGGRCLAGVCQNGDVVGSTLLWAKEHKQTSAWFGVSLSLVLCGLLCCCGYYYRRHGGGYSARRRKSVSSITTPFMNDMSGWDCHREGDIEETSHDLTLSPYDDSKQHLSLKKEEEVSIEYFTLPAYTTVVTDMRYKRYSNNSLRSASSGGSSSNNSFAPSSYSSVFSFSEEEEKRRQ